MRQFSLVLGLAVLLPASLVAQVRPAAPDSVLRRRSTEVASKFEEFSGRRAALFTRTTERIGEIRAEGYRVLLVSVVTMTAAGAEGGSASALAFGTRYVTDYPTAVGLVDEDEMSSFVDALALMEKRAPDLSTAANTTDAIYTTHTGLQVSVEGKGKSQRLFISSARRGIDPFEFEIQDVARLRALVEEAARKLK